MCFCLNPKCIMSGSHFYNPKNKKKTHSLLQTSLYFCLSLFQTKSVLLYTPTVFLCQRFGMPPLCHPLGGARGAPPCLSTLCGTHGGRERESGREGGREREWERDHRLPPDSDEQWWHLVGVDLGPLKATRRADTLVSASPSITAFPIDPLPSARL